MCSYCGCEAEKAISRLMADHAVIGDLAYRIEQALDGQRLDEARGLTAELAEVFARHSREEEVGLFARLTEAGEAEEEVGRLVADHRRLRPGLAAPDVANDPESLRRLLAELARHAQVEDNDLFPFAMQQLPATSWDELLQTTG